MLLQPGGNVGIGTINPNSKLEVDGIVHSTGGGFRFPDGTMQTTAATAGALVSVNGVSGDPSGDVDFIEGDNITITPNPAGNSITFSSPADGHSLDAADGSPIDAVYVDADGSVGIGIPGPGERLDVTGPGDTGAIIQTSATDNHDAWLRIRGARTTSYTSDIAQVRFENNEAGGAFEGARISMVNGDNVSGVSIANLVFYTNTGTSLTEKMRVLGSGYVGIGTPAPQAKLDVNGDIHTTGEFTKEFTTGTNNHATPIAYAFIAKNGAVASGTPNVSSTWDALQKYYKITISGENYSYSSYVTVVTPCGGPYVASTSSGNGKLIVSIYDLTGSKVQGYFQFVTYKP